MACGVGDRPCAQAVRAARAARRAQRGHGPVGDGRDGQDDRRCSRGGRAGDRDGRGGLAVPTTMQGRILEDVSRNIDAETVRQPVGVCAAIVPFNFPAMVPFWFLPFAIACGNTFVLKPSEQVPLTQQIAFEEVHALGLPAGVVNLVNGGRDVVEGILEHPDIDASRSSAPRRGEARLRARGADRKAGSGPWRRQEPHGRDAGCCDRKHGRWHRRLGLRGGRSALHGRLGRRDCR